MVLPRVCDEDEELDIESGVETPKPWYNLSKAQLLMDECRKHISLVRAEEGDITWEHRVDRFVFMCSVLIIWILSQMLFINVETIFASVCPFFFYQSINFSPLYPKKGDICWLL